MKFVAKVQFSAEIKNFERFDYSDFEYVDFSNEMKRKINAYRRWQDAHATLFGKILLKVHLKFILC